MKTPKRRTYGIVIGIVFLTLTLFLSGYWMEHKTFTPSPGIGIGSGESLLDSSGSQQMEASELSLIERISIARGRHANKNFIEQGDLAMLEAAYGDAEKYYSVALSKNPNDPVLIQKYATSLYALKRYSDTFTTLSPIGGSLSGQLRSLLLRSYSKSDHIEKTKDYISQSGLTPEERSYLSIVQSCLTGVDNCIVSLNEYKGENELIKSIAASYAKSSDITQDKHYRDALLAGAWYKGGESLLSMKIITQVLTERPDYLPAKKIAAFSAYDLGDYTQANSYFIEYLSRDPLDAASLFALGQTKIQNEDWVGASDALNRAVLAGYTPKIDVERKIVATDAKLGNYDHMLTVFAYILKDETAQSDDFATALLVAIMQDAKTELERWSEDAYKKYPQDNDIKGYYIASRYLLGKSTEGDVLLEDSKENISLLVTYAKYLQSIERRDNIAAEGWQKEIEEKDLDGVLQGIMSRPKRNLEKLQSEGLQASEESTINQQQ